MLKKITIGIFTLLTQILFAQNLILNSSFSNVKPKVNKLKPYKIASLGLSQVEDWYVPDYIYKLNLQSPYQFSYFYSSRDKDLIPKNRRTQFITNGEQLFENNLGFIYMNVMRAYSLTVIQQKIQKKLSKGNYCFKFKYKFNRFSSSYNRPVSLEFAFSPTNLQEYLKKTFQVPPDLIKISFKDTLNEIDENEPWIQECFIISLNGNENFLSIGTLSNKDKYPWGTFFIDDIELNFLVDTAKCNCEAINKDLIKLSTKNFPLNQIIQNDTLVMFAPSFNVGSGIISPEAKKYLKDIISFMQRNPTLKLKFTEYREFADGNRIPTYYAEFYRYITFFGINKNRISVENGLCYDLIRPYCGKFAEFVKIGVTFYQE